MIRTLSAQFRALACLALFIGLLTSAHATEYALDVYFADRKVVAETIGSNNPALEKAMLSDQAYVEDIGLEQRFSDSDMWKRAVSDLVAGKPRENADINGFALVFMLRQLAGRDEQNEIGLPFADLYEVSAYFKHAGETQLADLFSRIDYWPEPQDTQANALWQKLGHTEYHSRISVIFHEEASGFLAALDRFDTHLQGVSDFLNNEPTPAAKMFEYAARKAATEQWSEFAERNTEDDETPEQLVERMVTSTMEDPYQYYQNIESVSYELDKIRAWLRRADNRKQDMFSVLYSY